MFKLDLYPEFCRYFTGAKRSFNRLRILSVAGIYGFSATSRDCGCGHRGRVSWAVGGRVSRFVWENETVIERLNMELAMHQLLSMNQWSRRSQHGVYT